MKQTHLAMRDVTKLQKEILKWSNLFFLIPFVIATIFSIYWYSVILLALFIVSFDFHYFNEAKEVYYLDVFFSSILMFSNFVLLFMGHWRLPFSVIAVFLAIMALFFYFRRSQHSYYINHSLWHIFSAGVCLFCLITFAML